MKSFNSQIRSLALAASAVMLTAALSSGALAAPGKENLGSAAKVNPDAVTIDGTKDAVYDKGLKVSTKDNSGGISADGWLLWSNGYLYFYAEVADPDHSGSDLSKRATAPWEIDSIEIFVDEDNDGANYGMQYRVDYGGYGTWKDRNANVNYYTPDVIGDDFEYAAKETANGYTAEMRVPLRGKQGNEVGINIQVNDISATSYLVKDGWNTPEYPYFTLGELIAEEKVEPTVDNAPATADAAAIAVFAAAVSGASVALARKKKH